MRSNIRQFFVKEGMADRRILVAVSGGTDSTALLLLLRELGLNIVAAHVNHHLRGAESDADEAFVRALCATENVPLRVADGTLDPQRIRERGIEAAAREVRYAQLARLREEEGAACVATAHQKNDQAETVLLRLLTGSGLAGLRGIHPHRADGVVRPLLEVTREQLEAYLAGRGIVPRADGSNEDPRFLRNRIRAFLREVDATDNLARVAGQARAQWPVLERAIDDAERECVTVTDDASHFLRWPDDEWLRGALLQRHIRRLDPQARDFDAARIAREIGSIRRMSVTGNLELIVSRDHLVLRRLPVRTAAFELPLEPDRDVYIPAIGRTVHLRQTPDGTGQPSALNGRPFQPIELPPGAVPSFTVRNRREGDRFQPLGMRQPKKLKDFLIDRKIDADARDRLPLLVWNGEIVWIAGVEVSERFKVRGAGGVLCEVWIDERDSPAGLQR
jgi:tRNA(Ile)-lysidine synthase